MLNTISEMFIVAFEVISRDLEKNNHAVYRFCIYF